MTIPNKSPAARPAVPADPDAAHIQSGRWILAATILASSMAFIDGTVVNLALPALETALHATITGMQWVVESYALLLASLLLLGGSLGDRYGRRKVFLFGVLLFAAASAWCGFAPSILSLILARGVQGVGAACLVPGSLALISASFPVGQRGQAIGTWSGSTAITASIGPVLGGWLIQNLSWRWVFFLNLPLAILVVVLTLWRVPESRNPSAPGTLDWPGAVLGTLGLGVLTFALIEAPRGGAGLWICALAGLAALGGFLLVETRSAAPMVSLHLFRSRDFTGANLLTFLLYAALSGLLFFFPLDLIQVQHDTATQAGAALLPLILLMFALSRWSGGLVIRYGARLPLTIGPVVTAAGFLLFLRPGVGGSYWLTFFPAVVVLGLGMAISVAPLTTAVMQSVPTSESGIASGVNNAVSRLAGLFAIAAFGLVLSAGFNTALDRALKPLSLSPALRHQVDQQRPRLAAARTSNPAIQHAFERAFVSGYREVIAIAAGLALLSALTAQMIGPRRRQTPPPPRPPRSG